MSNTKMSNTFNCIKCILKFIVILIFILIVIGCFVAWRANYILLNFPNDSAELEVTRASLMNTNTITFMVTLIVGLLASLLVHRIDKMESLVLENKVLKSQTVDYISKTISFDVMLTRVESIYYLVNMMNNITDINISQNLSNFVQVGHLCNRIEPIRYRIQESLDRKELSFSKVTYERKEILNTYFDEIVGFLEGMVPLIRDARSLIFSNIEILCRQMKLIKEQIKVIPLEDGE